MVLKTRAEGVGHRAQLDRNEIGLADDPSGAVEDRGRTILGFTNHRGMGRADQPDSHFVGGRDEGLGDHGLVYRRNLHGFPSFRRITFSLSSRAAVQPGGTYTVALPSSTSSGPAAATGPDRTVHQAGIQGLATFGEDGAVAHGPTVCRPGTHRRHRRWGSLDPDPKGHDLDRVAGRLRELEHPAMRLAEPGNEILGPHLVEIRIGERDRHLEGLTEISHLEHPIEVHRRPDPELGKIVACLRLQLIDGSSNVRHVGFRDGQPPGPGSIVDMVGEEESGSGQDPGVGRHDDGLVARSSATLAACKGPAPPKGTSTWSRGSRPRRWKPAGWRARC